VRSRTTLSRFTCASPPSQHVNTFSTPSQVHLRLRRYFGHHQQSFDIICIYLSIQTQHLLKNVSSSPSYSVPSVESSPRWLLCSHRYSFQMIVVSSFERLALHCLLRVLPRQLRLDDESVPIRHHFVNPLIHLFSRWYCRIVGSMMLYSDATERPADKDDAGVTSTHYRCRYISRRIVGLVRIWSFFRCVYVATECVVAVDESDEIGFRLSWDGDIHSSRQSSVDYPLHPTALRRTPRIFRPSNITIFGEGCLHSE
jgi:hypothetical protein